ncbi:transposase [Bosea sp. (in: a-proteobacteria)]|uniref:transposase n=1 Tax=Bosea sp. (in: a-proteobacteria) TaxID=1871050 RepID=UPI003F70E4FB
MLTLSHAKMELMIRDRLSWTRFLRFDLGALTPDENTIRHFHNRLTETGTPRRVIKAFEWQLQCNTNSRGGWLTGRFSGRVR